MVKWFAEEALWVDSYAYTFTQEKLAVAEREVRDMLSLIRYQSEPVLDLCCGVGRHALALARRGIKVTAVDLTKYLLDEARTKAVEAHLDIEFVCEDMRRFVRHATFGLAFNMFSSFGYFDDRDDDFQVVSHVYQSLLPGGAFLIDLMSRERLLRHFQPTSTFEAADGSRLFQRHVICNEGKLLREHWTFFKDDEVKTYRFAQHIYSGPELRDLLRRAGFAEVNLYGDLRGRDWSPDAPRLIAVGRKPLSATNGRGPK